MPDRISEMDLIKLLKRGVERTKNLIAHATDYHGGPATTEYLLTADIAREFIEAHFETEVEFLNRRLVNPLTECRTASKLEPLKGERTDVVLLYTPLVPVALIEVKIRVATLNGIRDDLDKITNTFKRLNLSYALKVIGAIVFQMHVGVTKKTQKRTTTQQIRAEIERREARLKSELSEYVQHNDAYQFRLEPLQEADEGITPSDEENVGQATRYYAILIRDKRAAPLP